MPRIYVASLTDYNNGRLHGVWIDALLPVDKMREAVRAMLASTKFPPAEDWAIHDFEGFGNMRLSEATTLESAHRAAIERGT